jgi:hypothetical protein
MSGNETQRFCSYCKKHVHNLEALSLSERLALLTSPAASICSRYRVAIRRPAKGKEKSYFRHLLKYGAGVAVTGSVLLVLWEMHEPGEKKKYYRAVAATKQTQYAMRQELYEEQSTVLLGRVSHVPFQDPRVEDEKSIHNLPIHFDLDLDKSQVDQLLNGSKPLAPSEKLSAH